MIKNVGLSYFKDVTKQKLFKKYGIIGFIHDITYSNTNKCLQVVKKF